MRNDNDPSKCSPAVILSEGRETSGRATRQSPSALSLTLTATCLSQDHAPCAPAAAPLVRRRCHRDHRGRDPEHTRHFQREAQTRTLHTEASQPGRWRFVAFRRPPIRPCQRRRRDVFGHEARTLRADVSFSQPWRWRRRRRSRRAGGKTEGSTFRRPFHVRVRDTYPPSCGVYHTSRPVRLGPFQGPWWETVAVLSRPGPMGGTRAPRGYCSDTSSGRANRRVLAAQIRRRACRRDACSA